MMSTRDSRTEDMLTRFGVKWSYSNARTFEDLVKNWREHNLGRSKAKVEAAVLEFAERAENGSAAPAVILAIVEGVYYVLDGIQRLLADELRGITEFSAYVVETDSKRKRTEIRVMANALLGGHPESPEWTKRQAVQMLGIEEGASDEEIASLGGWKVNDIRDERVAMEWAFAIRCHGGPDGLPKNLLQTINKYATRDVLDKASKPVIEFVADLKQGRFSNGEAEPFIEKFFEPPKQRNKSPHKIMEERLEDFRKQTEVRAKLEGPPVRHVPAEMKLISALKAALTVANGVLKSRQVTPYVDQCFLLTNQIRDALCEIRDLKPRVKKVRVHRQHQ